MYAPNEKLISTTMGLMIQGGQSGQVFGPTLLALLVSMTGTWQTGVGGGRTAVGTPVAVGTLTDVGVAFGVVPGEGEPVGVLGACVVVSVGATVTVDVGVQVGART